MQRLTGFVVAVTAALFVSIYMALVPSDAVANHPDPLPDNWSANGWDIQFTDANPYTCMTPVAGSDLNFLPSAQARLMLQAIVGPYPDIDFLDPTGNLQGFADLGFSAPDFDGNDIEMRAFDCSPGGPHDDNNCDNGSAPADEIKMPSRVYCASAADNVLRVIGHELFHHVQFGYIDFSNWTSWGREAIEGSSRMMEDQVYTILDDGLGRQAFLNEANNYLANPGQPFWQASYQAALGWKYAAEQYGTIATEPQRGTDFVRRFWERAGAQPDDANTIGVFSDTIREFAPADSLRTWFHDFSIANLAKQFDASALPDASKYSYIDENDGNGTSFRNVIVNAVGIVPAGTTNGSIDMSAFASAYLRMLVGDCSNGDIIGFRGINKGTWTSWGDIFGGDLTRFAVMTVDNSSGVETIQELVRGASDDYGVAFVPDGSQNIDEISAVVTSMNSLDTIDWAFDCGPGTLDIIDPTDTYQAHIGPIGPDRQKLRVIVRVTGPATLSSPTVKGLQKEDFSVYIGTNNLAADEGTVSAIVEAGDTYQLTVWPTPDKASVGPFDLHVNLGSGITDTSFQSVSYDELIVDEVVLLDISGSMNDVTSPEGLTKIASAKGAASTLVDVANEAGKIGAVSFSGASNVVEALDDTNPVHRQAVVDGINALIAAGPTSIGAGADTAADQLVALGDPDQEDWIILLSDGKENTTPLWNSIKPGIQAAGIHVFTMALGQDADFLLMEQIANDTDGRFLPLDDDPSTGGAGGFGDEGVGTGGAAAPGTQSNALADAYLTANEVAEGKERLWYTTGNLVPGVPFVEQIVVEEGGIHDATFAFHWSNPSATIAVQITRPDSTVLSSAIPGVEEFSGSTHVVYHIETLDPGTWHISAASAAGNAEVIGVLAGKDLQGADLRLRLGGYHEEPNETNYGIKYLWGVPQPILAVLTDKNGPVLGATVRAEVEHPDGSLIDLPLYDDGTHGDGNTGDGVYGNVYTRTTSMGVAPNFGPQSAYSVSVVAAGTNNADVSFTRMRKTAFVVGEVADPFPDQDLDGMSDRYEDLHRCLNSGLSDGFVDPDMDDIPNFIEWDFGTNPCDPDTDGGGESDSSELNRGANPFDYEDDALPRPIDAEVVDWVLEHIPFPAGVSLEAGTNLIRYPDNPAYHRIRLWRNTTPPTGWAVVADFESSAFNGLYPDTGLTNGVTYHYMVQPVDLNGRVGVQSLVFSGTPNVDPLPPVGNIIVEFQRPLVQGTSVTLLITGSSDADEMMITNTPAYDAAAWQPFASTLPWLLVPEASGNATVYLRLRDTAGNESPTVYSDSIEVAPAGSLGSISGSASAAGVPDMSGVMIRIENYLQYAPTFTNPAGTWVLPDLEPGNYDLLIEFTDHELVNLSDIVVTAGSDTATGAHLLPEPGQGSSLVFGAALLGWMARRRAGCLTDEDGDRRQRDLTGITEARLG